MEKWGGHPRSDGSWRVKPEVQAAALCADVAKNPDLLDGKGALNIVFNFLGLAF